MKRVLKNPDALLNIVSRLDGLIDELKDGGQPLSARLIAMARLEIMMTVHRISEQEVGALRSLFEDEHRMLS
jgi:hypothetical protein